MRIRCFPFFLSVVLVFCSVSLIAAQSATKSKEVPITDEIIKSLVGDWKNQLGSTLRIKTIDKISGKIDGEYNSPSGTESEWFPLTGWVNTEEAKTKGDNVTVVAFSVRYIPYGSVATWNGYYKVQNGKSIIVTQWLLVRANSSNEKGWDHINIGQDVFGK